jgi:hypothetical protein
MQFASAAAAASLCRSFLAAVKISANFAHSFLFSSVSPCGHQVVPEQNQPCQIAHVIQTRTVSLVDSLLSFLSRNRCF